MAAKWQYIHYKGVFKHMTTKWVFSLYIKGEIGKS